MSGEKRLSLNGITLPQQMISSCCGAFATSIFMTPFDVIKIRLQAQQKPMTNHQPFIFHNGLMDLVCICQNGNNGNGSISTCNNTSHLHNHTAECLEYQKVWYYRKSAVKLNGTLDAMFKIARYEGVSSLWSGLPPTLVMSVPATVIYFTAYDYIKYWLGYHNGGYHLYCEGSSEAHNPNHVIPMAAGAIARLGAVSVISPLELLRTKMQSEKLTYIQLWRSLADSINHGGWGFLWRGFVPTILRDVPFSALYWYGYENCKYHGMKYWNLREPTFSISFTSGALAGTLAAVVTLPFDVIKTHRQMELGNLHVLNAEQTRRCTSTWVLLRKVFRDSGVRGLFAGIVPRLLKVAPACAIMISSYEVGKSFFRNYSDPKQQ